jgi:hypothetical protein
LTVHKRITMTMIHANPAPDPSILAALRHARTPVVFLDFDGVTHPEPTSGPVFVHLPQIEAVLRAYPQVNIVLSTSWRESFHLDVLRSNFSADISPRILDVTPVLDWSARLHHPAPLSRASRQAEIEAWLYSNLTMAHPWIALDDRAHWFDPGCRHLLFTNRRTGFTPADAKQLHRMLLERLP